MTKKQRTSELDTAPRTERDRKFCDAWLRTFDVERAWREAGFGTRHNGWHGQAQRKLQRFAGYLQPFQEAKAQKVIAVLVLDQRDVLQGMAAKALFDPLDFLERSDKPLTRKSKVPDGAVSEDVVIFNGEKVYPWRFKPLAKLTPAQRRTVQTYPDEDGNVLYTLPNAKVQHQYLESLGKQMGMFSEKLIVERHQHSHQRHTIDFQGVTSEQINEAMRSLAPLVGEDYLRQLGMTPEEIAALLAPRSGEVH